MHTGDDWSFDGIAQMDVLDQGGHFIDTFCMNI